MEEKKQRLDQSNLVTELKRLLEAYKVELERLKSLEVASIVSCEFCGGDGKEKRADGGPLVDGMFRHVPCRVCKGAGKVRI